MLHYNLKTMCTFSMRHGVIEVIFESNGFPMNFMNVHSDYDIKIQLVYLIFKIFFVEEASKWHITPLDV